MRVRAWAALGAVALVVAGLAVVHLTSAPAEPVATHAVHGPLDSCAEFSGRAVAGGLPDLRLPCIAGGADTSLAAAPGRPTVLTLWAAWCGPCRDELPLFQRLYEQSGQTVQVTGVVERDTLASTVAYAQAQQLSFPSVLDATGKLLTAEGLDALPLTYFLRADGTVSYRVIGPVTSYAALQQLVADHLGVTVSS